MEEEMEARGEANWRRVGLPGPAKGSASQPVGPDPRPSIRDHENNVLHIRIFTLRFTTVANLQL